MKINYAEMILALRVKLNISQQQLGDMLGVSFTRLIDVKRDIMSQHFLQKND